MLRDFDAAWRVVFISGRRFLVRRPTVAAVDLACRLFALEIESLRMSDKKLRARPVFEAMVEIARDRVALVVETIARGDGEPRLWPLAELLLESVRDTNLERIAESIGSPTDSVEGQDDSLMSFCRHNGISPTQLLEWPYEGFLTACDAMEREATKSKAPPYKGDLFAKPGSGVKVSHG